MDGSVPEEVDVLVYRRVREGSYAHIGGIGRGEGWAGIVELDLDEEPLLRQALAEREVVALHADQARRVAGPYWASHAAIVPLSHDVFVVVGGSEDLVEDAERCRVVAVEVSESIGEVTPAKRLADELELLHAVSDVAMTPIEELEEVASAVVRTAADVLSCEIGIVHLPGHDTTVVAVDPATGVRVTRAEAVAWADDVLAMLDGQQLVLQDLDEDSPLPDAAWAELLVSLIAVPLNIGSPGVLLVAHTTAGPRGFTQLCQQIAGSVAGAAAPVLMASTVQSVLRAEAASAAASARTDDLTGVPNRRAWEEALASAARREHGTVSVLVADVNLLKAVNDTRGHDAGDELLRAAARAILSAVRDSDIVARVGGDEFHALLIGVDEKRATQIADRARAAADDEDPSVSLAVGAATTSGSVDAAALERVVVEADRAMYADKAKRRR